MHGRHSDKAAGVAAALDKAARASLDSALLTVIRAQSYWATS